MLCEFKKKKLSKSSCSQAVAEGLGPYLPQLLWRKLQANKKQGEEDPKFSQRLHLHNGLEKKEAYY